MNQTQELDYDNDSPLSEGKVLEDNRYSSRCSSTSGLWTICPSIFVFNKTLSKRCS